MIEAFYTNIELLTNPIAWMMFAIIFILCNINYGGLKNGR